MIVLESLRRGATGYLIKDEVKADELGKAVLSVQQGETVLGRTVGAMVSKGLGSTRSQTEHLSDRELEVIRFVAKGLSNKQIAHEIFISESTVKFHLQNASKKLTAHNRAELVSRASAAGLL
jgi:DNA-binding NarL/FixJ family response regulator